VEFILKKLSYKNERKVHRKTVKVLSQQRLDINMRQRQLKTAVSIIPVIFLLA
jgi:hypothetical protein